MHQLQNQSVVILGGGPTGLGAARSLTEIGDVYVRVFDENPAAGGLASSFVDSNGFTWDIGGHVQFSHYRYFDDLMNELLGDQWLEHTREAWIWMRDRFIPYPLQKNIHLLPQEDFLRCINGLRDLAMRGAMPIENFQDWIEASFGVGLAEIFLVPYNFKVWAHQPSTMSHQWVGERVATIDLERIIANANDGHIEKPWGPNSRFRFPACGGTGKIWRTLADQLPAGVFQPNCHCVRIDSAMKMVYFEDGSQERYDRLISTIPLDILISLANLESLKPCISQFRYSAVHVIGIGLKGTPPPQLKSKCWMYFPEDDCPFYRATVFSNYSPNNVPDISRFWSLLLEISESRFKPVDRSGLVDSTVEGLLATKLIESPNQVAGIWTRSMDHGYPTPFLGRDRLVEPILAELEKVDIYSRGRFGGWKYEVSNQDHSLMQGVELVNRLAFGIPEVTYWFPDAVNGSRRQPGEDTWSRSSWPPSMKGRSLNSQFGNGTRKLSLEFPARS